MIRNTQRLSPLTDAWNWQLHARCRNMDSDLFFPHDDERRGERIRRERVAKEICIQCPVRSQCTAHAVSIGEPFGIWGGTSEAERRQLRADTGTSRTRSSRPPLRISGRYHSRIIEKMSVSPT
ncbi:WhiB family transcriptional regulator [Rhodococcus koreensis]